MRLDRKGQMSLIMILVVAIAIVFYAVSINWTKISSYKTQVTASSITGTATLGSMMASYGEYMLWNTGMEGRVWFKESTSSLPKLIAAAVLAIIAIALSFVPGGQIGSVALGNIITGLLIGAGASLLGAGLDSFVAQPKITAAWQKSIANIPTMEGRFTEQGVQSMLFGVVNDGVEVYDRWDVDMDGRWYKPGAAGSDPTAKISRFDYYYYDRLNPFRELSAMEVLQQVLKDIQDHLGLATAFSDGTLNSCTNASGQTLPQCNPCCREPMLRMHRSSRDGNGGCSQITPYLPECAIDNPACTETSLSACYVYDQRYEKTQAPDPDKFMSFFGEDDPDAHMKVSAGTLVAEVSPFLPVRINSSSDQKSADGGVYRGGDTAGQVFPFLWLLSDTNPYVKDLWTNGTAVSVASPACHWRSWSMACQTEFAAVSPNTVGEVFFRPSVATAPLAYTQLSGLNSCQNGDCYVNLFKNVLTTPSNNPSSLTGYDPRRIDGVKGIQAFVPVANTACSPDTTGKYWKKGSQRLNQTFLVANTENTIVNGVQLPDVWPIRYMDGNTFTVLSQCLAEDNTACICTAAKLKPERWRSDPFDDATKALSDFSSGAMELVLVAPYAINAMEQAVTTWGPLMIARANALGSIASNMSSWVSEIDQWLAGDSVENLNPDNTEKYNYTDTDLWCLPQMNDPLLTQDEKDHILAGGTWGTLGSVAACLQYNSQNYNRFNACYNWKKKTGIPSATDPDFIAACTDLPRSLLPAFNPNNDATQGSNYNFYQTFGGCYDNACVNSLNANGEYNIEEFQEAVYDAAIAKCTADACQATYDVCLKECDDKIASCNGVPECLATFQDCKGVLCKDAFDACTPGTCTVGNRCYDDDCLAAVKTAADNREEPYYKIVLDQAAFDAAKDKYCLYEQYTEEYDYSTTYQRTRIDPCTGLSPDGPKDSEYMKKIKDSTTLAYNQSIKFNKRYQYLNDLMTRAVAIRAALQGAVSYLTSPFSNAAVQAEVAKFLGAAQTPPKTVSALIEWIGNNAYNEINLGNDVVYGWFSPPAKGSKREYGYLHIVRVQASLPGNRGAIASTFPVTLLGAQSRPWIDSWTNWTGTKRYYELKDRTGYTGARVIRFDEDHSDSGLSFLSGAPLWTFLYSNPRGETGGDVESLIKSVHTNCAQHYKRMITGHLVDAGGSGFRRDGSTTVAWTDLKSRTTTEGGIISYVPVNAPDPEAKEGFMFDMPVASGAPGTLSACASAVDALIRRGVASEACVNYKTVCADGNEDCHYDLKFVSCK